MRDALLRTISFDAPNGKAYRLKHPTQLATLLVRWVAWGGRLSQAAGGRRRPTRVVARPPPPHMCGAVQPPC